MTTELTIRQLFETAIAAIAPAIATAWENTPFTPASGTPYQAVNILFADPENPTYRGFARYLGYLQVTLRYPIGVGVRDIMTQAGLVKAAFPYGRTFTSGTISLTVKATATIGPGRADGDRWVMPVKIPFFANVFE